MIRVIMILLMGVIAANAALEFEYVSHLGGDGYESLPLVVLDEDGYIIAMSTTTPNLQTTPGCVDSVYATGSIPMRDLYLSSHSPDHQLIAATYLGGIYSENAVALERLPDGDILLVAESSSDDFQAETDYSSGQYAHIFIARLSADLTTLRWSTRLGSGNWGIDTYSVLVTHDSVIIPWYASENDGDGYITGNGYITFLDLDDGIRTSEHIRNGNISQTLEGDLILFGQRYDGAQVTEGVYQSENNGQTDGYFTVVTQDLEVIWATFLGGSGHEVIQGVTTMSDGSFVVCMETESSDLPVLNASWSRPNVQLGDRDLYVARLSGDGRELLWAGYLGGSDHESLADMEVDDQDHVLICGWTKSTDFPTTPGAPYPENNCTAWYDGFITRLDGLSGAMSSWSTYLFDETCVGPYDISVSNGRFALVGLFNPSWGGSLVPTTPDAIDQESVGMENFIIIATDPDLVPLDPTPPPNLIPGALTLTLTTHRGSFFAFRVDLPQPAGATIKIYDLRGRIITTIHEGALPAGSSEFEWDGRTSDGKTSPRGAYCLTLQALDQKATRTIMIR